MTPDNDQQTVPQNPPATPRPGGEDEPIDRVPLYRRGKVIIPILITLTALAAGGWFWYINQRDWVSTDDATIEGHRSTVSAKIIGRIAMLAADEGDTVRAGQTLARLDDADLAAQEAQARAALTLAGQNVALAGTGIAKAEEDFARADVQFRDRIIPPEPYDHAQQELDAARARRAVALAQTGTARAQLDLIRTQRANALILAPMDGVVSKRWALAGDVVQPGQAIFSIYDLRDLWVTANLEETSLRQLRIGDTVELHADAYPDAPLAGRVLQIGANTAAQFSLIPPNNAAGNFTKVTQRVPVKISVAPAPSMRLLPGMSVEVRIRVR